MSAEWTGARQRTGSSFDEPGVGVSDRTGLSSGTDVDALIDRALPEVYRYAVRLTGGDRGAAEDLTQDAFVELARHLRSHPEDVLDVGWLVVVVRRRWVDRLRKRRREDERLAFLEPPVEHEPDWSLVEGGVALSCLGQLAEHQRAALIFRYVDDLSLHEVADLLGRSPAATESLLARARRALGHLVEEARHG